MRHAIDTEIEIDATPDEVWTVLTTTDEYPEWNPFIVELSGELVVGGRLRARLEPPGGRGMVVKPTVTAVDDACVFEWLGRLMVSGLFDGRHRFELHPTPSGGTRLVHSEAFSGLLVRPLRKMLDGPTTAGFRAMNEALKQRAESRARESSTAG